MKKSQKNRLIELLNILNDSCIELSKKNDSVFIDLCAEIQEFVGSIYCFAGEIFGKNHKIIKFLETFYQYIYLVSIKELEVEKLLDLLVKILKDVEMIKVDKFEVVFFCYKASMSDCFESIYFAAKSDIDCEVYFVPIPYYDKNPDGTFSKMYFEGIGCYTDKYELTDWRKYNVEERKPDVIFLMNPYDDANYVTSVHPNFYSNRLKEYTDCLIHIDYGMALWTYKEPNKHINEINLKGKLTPVQYNSDYLFVYKSEFAEHIKIAFKQNMDYIRYYGMDPNTIDTKILSFGSPKFDKILNSKKADFVLPEEWKKKINNKKIILYNTSLAEFLSLSSKQFEQEKTYLVKDDKYFSRLKTTLEEFKNRNDVVLWWRPHPLFESTLKSMRPAFYEYYIGIVNEYKELDYGIFDITEDLHRAIFFSDAMISDRSSLIWLYLATGKPFYIPGDPDNELDYEIHHGNAFHIPIQDRIVNMWNDKIHRDFRSIYSVHWSNFFEYNVWRKIKYNNYQKRFIHYVVSPDEYPERMEHERLQKEIFSNSITNSDGTAGQKIYEFAKQKAFENANR